MATATPFAPHLSTHEHDEIGRRVRRPVVPMQPVIRRRGSPEQGRALEMLGHALEYLEDSRMYGAGGVESAELSAIQILRKSSRMVFAECPMVVPLRERLSRWVGEYVFGM